MHRTEQRQLINHFYTSATVILYTFTLLRQIFCYLDMYIELNNERKDESLQFVSDHYKWVGYYTEVFVGEYDGHYHGYVDEQYKDRRIREGCFHSIERHYND